MDFGCGLCMWFILLLICLESKDLVGERISSSLSSGMSMSFSNSPQNSSKSLVSLQKLAKMAEEKGLGNPHHPKHQSGSRRVDVQKSRSA